nr:MAG TPA: hypothetical protein [Caudoviricetes sp.]
MCLYLYEDLILNIPYKICPGFKVLGYNIGLKSLC